MLGLHGTAGGLGVSNYGAVKLQALEHQAGKPLYDVFVNLPIEFASFGMIPSYRNISAMQKNWRGFKR